MSYVRKLCRIWMHGLGASLRESGVRSQNEVSARKQANKRTRIGAIFVPLFHCSAVPLLSVWATRPAARNRSVRFPAPSIGQALSPAPVMTVGRFPTPGGMPRLRSIKLVGGLFLCSFARLFSGSRFSVLGSFVPQFRSSAVPQYCYAILDKHSHQKPPRGHLGVSPRWGIGVRRNERRPRSIASRVERTFLQNASVYGIIRICNEQYGYN
jgi:hypothetical protein